MVWGWVGGWKNEGKSHFKDCLQQSKIELTLPGFSKFIILWKQCMAERTNFLLSRVPPHLKSNFACFEVFKYDLTQGGRG